MSLVHTIGELSDYANNVGGLLRLKRREEEWVSVEEWLNLNKQIKELEAENQQLKNDVKSISTIEETYFKAWKESEKQIAKANTILGDCKYESWESFEEVIERLRSVLK